MNHIYIYIEKKTTKKRYFYFFCFLKHSSSTKVDASVETVSIGLATEPDQLGPCEPVCRFFCSLNLI
jgi:hypothetical protein